MSQWGYWWKDTSHFNQVFPQQDEASCEDCMVPLVPQWRGNLIFSPFFSGSNFLNVLFDFSVCSREISFANFWDSNFSESVLSVNQNSQIIDSRILHILKSLKMNEIMKIQKLSSDSFRSSTLDFTFYVL